MTKQEWLLKMFFAYKAKNSCCMDEEIDWNQHDMSLDVKELEEYTKWLEAYNKLLEDSFKLVGYHSSLIYYALRPWSAEKDNIRVEYNIGR